MGRCQEVRLAVTNHAVDAVLNGIALQAQAADAQSARAVLGPAPHGHDPRLPAGVRLGASHQYNTLGKLSAYLRGDRYRDAASPPADADPTAAWPHGPVAVTDEHVAALRAVLTWAPAPNATVAAAGPQPFRDGFAFPDEGEAGRDSKKALRPEELFTPGEASGGE